MSINTKDINNALQFVWQCWNTTVISLSATYSTNRNTTHFYDKIMQNSGTKLVRRRILRLHGVLEYDMSHDVYMEILGILNFRLLHVRSPVHVINVTVCMFVCLWFNHIKTAWLISLKFGTQLDDDLEKHKELFNQN